jgi:hypothetical protein
MSEAMRLLPSRIARLPRDIRGYPVPWFVYWDEDGQPDFRVIGPGRIEDAIQYRKCWVCGEQMGRFMAFVSIPVVAINRSLERAPVPLGVRLIRG